MLSRVVLNLHLPYILITQCRLPVHHQDRLGVFHCCDRASPRVAACMVLMPLHVELIACMTAAKLIPGLPAVMSAAG